MGMYKKIILVGALVGFSLVVIWASQAPSRSSQCPSSVNDQALQALLAQAKKTNSDAVVILHDGKLLAEYYATDKPVMIQAMSMTKSIVSLAFGLLLSNNLLKSLDQKVSDFYPEWKQGRKNDIAIRHLLNHTSGLQDEATSEKIYATPDFVKFALAADLSCDPGSCFFYSNKAVNLLPDIAKKVSGLPMDEYLQRYLFDVLGIKKIEWQQDEAGNVHGMAGLSIYPADLAKIGQFVLQRGVWNNKRLIADAWFDESMRPSQSLNQRCGLLWWLVPEFTTSIIDDQQIEKLREAKLSEAFLERVKLLKGTYASTDDRYDKKLEEVLGKQWETVLSKELRGTIVLSRKEYGPVIGYAAEGYLGQYLVIYPAKKLVGVRMIIGNEMRMNTENEKRREEESFSDFAQLLYRVIN